LPQSADHENSLVGKQQSQLRSWQLPVLKIGFFETTILPTSKRLFALLGFAHNPSIDELKKLSLFSVRNSLFVAENSLFSLNREFGCKSLISG
jgi:hypothetical protein